MKTKYLKFSVNEIVMLNESIISDGKHIDKECQFTIKDFPCYVYQTHRTNLYFVFGIDVIGNIIRCDINQIIKIK